MLKREKLSQGCFKGHHDFSDKKIMFEEENSFNEFTNLKLSKEDSLEQVVKLKGRGLSTSDDVWNFVTVNIERGIYCTSSGKI